jgi:hypothetical protein
MKTTAKSYYLAVLMFLHVSAGSGRKHKARPLMQRERGRGREGGREGERARESRG